MAGKNKKKAKASTAEARETVVVTDGRTYRRARYIDLIKALFPDPEEAEWAFAILAPVLGQILRERPDADADIKQIADEDIREAFYEAVLQAVQMPFMAAPKIEAAVREELGWTYRKEKEVLDRVGLTLAATEWFGLFAELDAIEAQTRKSGEPLSHGTSYRKEAYIKLAKRLRADGKKISTVALERRLQRLKKSQARTPEQEQRAREYDAHLETFHVVERADGFYVERPDVEAGAPTMDHSAGRGRPSITQRSGLTESSRPSPAPKTRPTPPPSECRSGPNSRRTISQPMKRGWKPT